MAHVTTLREVTGVRVLLAGPETGVSLTSMNVEVNPVSTGSVQTFKMGFLAPALLFGLGHCVMFQELL